MERVSHVPNAGWSNHCTSKIPGVSESQLLSYQLALKSIAYSLGKREIRALPLNIKCDNAYESCEWEGTIGSLDDHVANCNFTPVPCPNKCKKDSSVLSVIRKDLEKHLEECMNRDYECKLCGKKDTYANITGAHDDKCKKKVLPCLNAECTETMEHGEIKKHLNECEHTVISCKYKNLGCEVGLKRKEKETMEAHEQDDKAHLHLTLRTLDTRRAFIRFQLKGKIMYTFRDITFERVATICICYHGDYVNVYLSQDVKCFNVVRVELLNQLEDKNHYVKTMEFNEDEFKPLIFSELSHDPVNNTEYLKEDCLYFRISLGGSDDKPWASWLKYNYLGDTL